MKSYDALFRLALPGLLLLALSACQGQARPAPTPESAVPPAGNVIPAPDNRVGAWSMALSPDGSRVIAPCVAGLCFWESASGELSRTMPGGARVAASPDGSLLATDGRDGSLRLLDAASGDELRTMQGHTLPQATDARLGITALAFSPDGAMLASAAHDGSVRLWRVADGAALQNLQTGSSRPTAIAFSADGATLAVTSTDQPVQLWEVATGRPLATLAGSAPQGYGIAFSPDGRWLATASSDPAQKLYLWEAAARTLVATFPEAVSAHDLAFSPDSTLLAFSNKADKSVRLWSVGGEESRTLTGHTDTPYAVRFSPDGQYLYSASSRDGILQWATVTGELLRRFDLP